MTNHSIITLNHLVLLCHLWLLRRAILQISWQVTMLAARVAMILTKKILRFVRRIGRAVGRWQRSQWRVLRHNWPKASRALPGPAFDTATVVGVLMLFGMISVL